MVWYGIVRSEICFIIKGIVIKGMHHVEQCTTSAL